MGIFTKSNWLILVIIWSGLDVVAQPTNLADTATVQQLLDDAVAIRKDNRDTAFLLIEKASVLAEKINDPSTLARVFRVRANTTKFNGAFLATLPDYQQSLKYYRMAGDSIAVAEVLGMVASNYMVMDRYTNALNHYLQAVNIWQEHLPEKRKSLIGNYRNIGNVYISLKDFEQAESYLTKGIDLATELQDSNRIIVLKERFGILEYQRNNFSKSLQYLKEVVAYREEKYGTARHAYRHLATTLEALGRDDEALSFYNKAIAYGEDRGKVRPLAAIQNYIQAVDFHVRKNNTEQAFDYLNKALTVVERHPNISFNMRGEVMKRLAQLTEQRGNYQKALQYYKSYALVRDSLSYEQQNQRLDELRAAFETEQKEIEIQQLKSQEAQRTQERNYLIGGIIMLGLLGWYIFSLLRKNNRQLKTEVQQKKRIENLLLEKNQLFDDLQNAQERLIHNEKMASLGQLTAGIAHEINNPINFISTSTQALNLDFEDLKELLEKVIHLQRNGKDESTIQEIIQLSKSMDLPYLKDEIYSLLGSVTRGVSRTEKIISGLRTYSRRGENEFLPDDINNCIKEALLILEPKITTQIQVHQDLQQLPLVECQIDKLNQVFVNLIGNGIDAMEGNGELFISTQNTDNQVIIKIRDTGKGMDKITQQRIFEPFFSTKKIGKGTGLGLFISYGVVKQHGGEIKVESEIGEGTTFSIYLPIQHGKLISSLR